MQDKKILISGAGVAGLTLAFWLRQYGFVPTLIEKNPAFRKGGYKIDIRGVAVEIVKKMGLYEKIVSQRTEIKKAIFVDHEGNEISEMHGDLYGLRSGEDVEIMRGDLCQILSEAVEGVDIIFNDEISMIHERDDGVEVEFKNRAPCSFDLVVGADGLHSTVRNLIFGKESLFLRPLGLYISIFSIPNFLGLDRSEIEYQEEKRFVNVFCTKDSGARAAFVFVSPINPSRVLNPKELLLEEFKGSAWKVSEILSHIKEAPDFYFDTVAQIHMSTWSQGRVVLLGDAGYAASPMSGQGTSLALVGAYVLARELSLRDYKKAFDRYEKSLRSFTRKNQKLAISSVAAVTGMGSFYLPRFLLKFYLKWSQKRSLERIKKAATAFNLEDISDKK